MDTLLVIFHPVQRPQEDALFRRNRRRIKFAFKRLGFRRIIDLYIRVPARTSPNRSKTAAKPANIRFIPIALSRCCIFHKQHSIF